MKSHGAIVKSGLAARESSLFAALLCGTAAALGVVSGLSPVAALRVDVCECARAPETLVYSDSAKLAFCKTLGAGGEPCDVTSLSVSL